MSGDGIERKRGSEMSGGRRTSAKHRAENLWGRANIVEMKLNRRERRYYNVASTALFRVIYSK